MNTFMGFPTWSGKGTYVDAVTASVESVDLVVTTSGFAIGHEKYYGTFLWNHVTIVERGGSGYIQIALPSRGGGMVTIYDEHALATIAQLLPQKRSLLTLFNERGKIILGIVAVFAAGVMFYMVILDLVVDLSVDLISRETEVAIGRSASRALLDGEMYTPDSATTVILGKCLLRLKRMGDPEVEYRIVIVEDREIVNGFAFPGGDIVIYRGLLDQMETQDEFLALLGHELGHIELRHGLKNMVRSTFLNVLAALIFRDVGGITSLLISQSSVLLQLSYSREEEFAADIFGADALIRAGLDPHGFPKLLERFSRESNSALTFLSTHPHPDERAERMSAYLSHVKSNELLLEADEWHHLRQR